jgi:hypothetical protein
MRGVILTWRKNIFICEKSNAMVNLISADLRLSTDNTLIRMTEVYGPSSGTGREEFL